MGGSNFSCSGGLTPPSRNGRGNCAVWVTGVKTRCMLPDGWPPLPPKIPRNTTAAYRCCNLLPQPLLNHWPPRHQTEPLSIVEHRVPPTGEHDTPPIYADHALTVSRLPILQPGFGANVPSRPAPTRARAASPAGYGQGR